MRRAALCLPVTLRLHQQCVFTRTSRFFGTALSPLSDLVTLPSTPIQLREYQEECIQSVLSYFEKGGRRAGISLATGSGKTVIFTHLIDRVRPPTPGATRTLILAHRRELVEQAALHCENAYPNKTVEIEMGNTKASGVADITVASVSSIISRDRMNKFDPKDFKLVLVDEAHHIVAASFMRALQHFGLLKASLPSEIYDGEDPTKSANGGVSPALVGVSATFSRFDGLRLSDAIDDIVYHKDYIDMIGDKWLSDLMFTTVRSKADISGVKAPGRDFQIGQLSRAVNNEESNEITVQTWMSKARGRKSTLVFCVDLAHVSDLCAKFRSHGIDAKFVTGDTSKPVRSERLDAFRDGRYPVLLNCGVFTEGTDIPNIDCVLLARPTKSQNLLVQMIGRGMRLHPKKDNCHIIDMVASLEAGIVTTPTLFGLDPAALVNEASAKDLSARREQELEAEHDKEAVKQGIDLTSDSQRARNVTFTHYDSVYDLIGDTSGEKHVRSISKLAWVRVRQNRYVLSTQGGDYLTIETTDDSECYSVIYMKRIRERIHDSGPKSGSKVKSPYMRPREIATAKSFATAVHAADTFASKQFPHHYIDHRQSWRKAPATDGQLAVVNKLRSMKDRLTASMISKGAANDMISKIKFGAKGWFSEMEADKKRQFRKLHRQDQQEQVRVGPVAQQRKFPREVQSSTPTLSLREALLNSQADVALATSGRQPTYQG